MRGWTSLLAAALLAGGVAAARAQAPVGTAFTYQGRLTDGGSPANGVYDLQFTLYDRSSAGSQVGTPVTLGSVSVANGLFTVSLDFGSSAFAGSKRWLEVGARPGGSTGSFVILTPRQELEPAPHAAFSVTTGDTTVQRRTVAPTCPSGQYVQSLAADGTPTCAPDLDTNSGGTVQTVATGAGLAGGPITLTGTVSVATGGISSGMIANGAVGSAQVNQAEVQLRVSAGCPGGQYLRAINPDGTVLCESVPPAPWVPTVITPVDDSADSVGQYTSIARGSDGLPVISYYDSTAGALRVAHCGNPGCSSGNSTFNVDDPFVFVGLYTSIAIGNDNLPVISYQDGSAFTLKVAHCGNAACTAGNTITTVDDPPANNVGYYTSIAIGADGRPVISYTDSTAGALKVAHCGNAACSAGNSTTTVDNPTNLVGGYTSIAIGTDGLPVISHYDATAGALKVAHCGNSTCTAGNTLTTVDNPANNVGQYSSIAIGSDGLPVISYHDSTAGSLKLLQCGNATCSAGQTITVVDDPGNTVGQYTSVAIGTDGLPVISYHDVTAGALKVAHCGNTSCGTPTITTVEDYALGTTGQYTAIAIGADGLPVISYYGPTGQALKVAKCGSRTCQ